jgi:hypothetical protein
MPNYNKSFIYKLCCKDPTITDIYIGSTTNFNRRKNQHKAACTNSNHKEHNNYKYEFIRANGGWINYDMILIQVVNVNNKRELEAKEREYIENLKATLNKQLPTQTKAEYYQNNKDTIIPRHIKYYEDNKDKIKENWKKPYNCLVCNYHVQFYGRHKHNNTAKHKLNLLTLN